MTNYEKQYNTITKQIEKLETKRGNDPFRDDFYHDKIDKLIKKRAQLNH